MELTWLDEPTVDALRAALRTVAPDLAEATIVPRGLEPSDDPQYCTASAVVDDRFVVKFAWAWLAALRICHQAQILDALRTAGPACRCPRWAVSRDPVMLDLRWVPATPFSRCGTVSGPPSGTGLRGISPRSLPSCTIPGYCGRSPRRLARCRSRRRTPRRIRSAPGLECWPDPTNGTGSVLGDWADTVLAAEGRTVLVHGDFHGDNHLWDEETLRLRLVIDLDTVGTGEPEFDLRCLPGDCGIELFTATVAHYEKLTGTKLDVDRIMAWHLRTVLGDALWRAEAGIPLPDKRTPVQWVDDLTARFAALGTFD